MRNVKIPATLIPLLYAQVAMAHQDAPDTSIVIDNQEDTYRRCLVVAETTPQAAIDMALRWRNLNGADPAQHCLAVAMMMAGDSEAAAPLLESLAEGSTATAPVRSGLYRQAGQARMDHADYSKALDAFLKAVALTDSDATLHLDIAIAHAATGDFWASIDDLNAALDANPGLVEALVLRGSAYRRLDFPDLAQDDLHRALGLQPRNTDALLELGLLARGRKDTDEARQFWIQVLEIAPSSPTADAVRQHLEEMDVQKP